MEAVTKETVETIVATDTKCVEKWQSMLKVFKSITENNPPIEEVRDRLQSLQESAKNSNLLTGAQKSGINDRCANYINGTWGKGLSHDKSEG